MAYGSARPGVLDFSELGEELSTVRVFVWSELRIYKGGSG